MILEEDKMKRFSKVFTLAMGLMVMSTGLAMAETQFTPLNFDDNSTIRTTSTPTYTSTTATEAKGSDLLDPSQVTGGTKMQNAMLQIDNAQVEVRNKLLNYKNSYAEIDARYKTTKAERKAAKKQIKLAEKKIKNLEKAKDKIRKNFERKINI